jgi:hypothetical protein
MLKRTDNTPKENFGQESQSKRKTLTNSIKVIEKFAPSESNGAQNVGATVNYSCQEPLDSF